jgi:hypothetical protein
MTECLSSRGSLSIRQVAGAGMGWAWLASSKRKTNKSRSMWCRLVGSSCLLSIKTIAIAKNIKKIAAIIRNTLRTPVKVLLADGAGECPDMMSTKNN